MDALIKILPLKTHVSKQSQKESSYLGHILLINLVLTVQYINLMCYSILYFKTSLKKNDGSVVLKSLYPEGPFKRYLCDVILSTLSIMFQFLFCGQESKQRIFSPGERNLYFLSFLWLNLLILLSYIPLSSLPLMMLLFCINRFLISCYY